MKTGKILSVAAILSTMVAADVQAAHGFGGFHGGGGGFHGGGMAFHGGGGGFARSAPAFGGGFARSPGFRSGGFVRPAGTFSRPVAFRQPVINQRFVNQRFVNERFAHRDHFDHRHNRNVVVIAGVPYAYPYYSSYYPSDYYSDYYPSDYYSDSSYYTAPSSTYATTYVAPTTYTYAVGGTSSVIVLQRRLAREGYYHGPIDGIMGPGTREALLRSERAHGHRPSSAVHRSHSSMHKGTHRGSHMEH